MSKNKHNLSKVASVVLIIIGIVVFNYFNEDSASSISDRPQNQQTSVQSEQPLAQNSAHSRPSTQLPTHDDSQKIKEAFAEQLNDVQVQAIGKLKKILPDDNEGSRHQRFIVELSTGDTILIAHNIDLAPRVENLSIGDNIEFYGVYEYNPQGGVVHWTHHDPQGQHIGGWLVETPK